VPPFCETLGKNLCYIWIRRIAMIVAFLLGKQLVCWPQPVGLNDRY